MSRKQRSRYEFKCESGTDFAEAEIHRDGEYYFRFRVELRDGKPVLRIIDEGNGNVIYPLREGVEDSFPKSK